MKLGLVGAGRWGKRYIATIADLPGIELARLASTNPASTSLVTRTCDVTNHWLDVATDSSLDGVILATPPSTHAEMTLAAIGAGLPVLIEKPMTLSVAEARSIAEASARQGVLVMVDHTHLFSAAYRELKRRGAELGALRQIKSCGANWGPFRADTPMLWDYGPHDVAMSIDLAGCMPRHVESVCEQCTTTHEGTGEAFRLSLSFNSGLEAQIRLANIDRSKSRWLRAEYEKGDLVYDDMADHKLTFVGGNANAREQKAINIEVSSEKPLSYLVREFSREIAKQRKWHPSLELAVQVVEVLAIADATRKPEYGSATQSRA